jgi:sugar phosphate isomerase/epimerase
LEMREVPEFFVSTTFISDGSPVEDALELCLKHDIRGVELGSNHRFERLPETKIEKYPDLSYLVHNYFPPAEEDLVVNIASLDDKTRESSIEHIRRCIDFSSQIGAQLHTFHPGFLSDPLGKSENSSNYDFRFEEFSSEGRKYEDAFTQMLESVTTIAEYARRKGVDIAIETEGSVDKWDHLLMQRIDEFDEFFRHFPSGTVGVNLNIGHLSLAANVFGFSWEEFVDAVADRVVAMELSHNQGQKDDHKPLIAGMWYWDIIRDCRFVNTYKILEFRNTAIEEIVACYHLCH